MTDRPTKQKQSKPTNSAYYAHRFKFLWSDKKKQLT